MNKISSLLVLLLLQCGLIAWLYSGSQSTSNTQKPEQALIKLDTSKINSITIKDENNKTVLLKKTDSGWLLPDYHQLAVDQGLLDQLFEKLASIQTVWPIARSEEAAERFHVSKTQFKRHVTFGSADNSTIELFLGDSPGLRKIYARNAKNADIYTVDLGLYLAPPEAERWFDKRLLKVRKDIDKIQGVDFVINKPGDTWSLEGMQENQTIEQARLESLVNALVYPQVKSVVGTDMLNQLKGKKVETHYKVQAGDDEINYDFYRVNDDVILKSSLSDLYFVIPIYVTENLLDVTRDKLIKKEKIKQEPEKS